MTDYEKVFIMRTTHTCDASSLDQDVRIAITFKRGHLPETKNAVYSKSALAHA